MMTGILSMLGDEGYPYNRLSTELNVFFVSVLNALVGGSFSHKYIGPAETHVRILNALTGESFSHLSMSHGEILARLYNALEGGGIGPSIALSNSSILESASAGALVGNLTIANASGNWLGAITYSLLDTAGNRFAIDVAAVERGATALNYEAATSHSITVQADNGTDAPISRVFAISVGNVLEVTLAALTLDDSSIPANASVGTVVGALVDTTAGSTLSLIDDEGGRYALDGLNVEVNGALSAGSDSITVRETHADGSNSPRDTVLAITVTAVDVTAPTISTLSPADNAVDVGITSNLVLTFDESVQFTGTVDIELRDAGGIVEAWDETDIGSGISISGAALTINPTASLDNSESYHVLITAGSIEDLAGNDFAGIASATTWNFTTVAAAAGVALKVDLSNADANEAWVFW